jgi:WD40 repeat protein
LSGDGARVFSGNSDGTLKLWDAATGAPLRTFERHSDAVLSIALSAGGDRVVSGSRDGTVKLWDAATGEPLRTFEGHSSWVDSVALSPSGNRIISGSWDTTTRIWDVATGAQLALLVGGLGNEWLTITPEGFFAASPNGHTLLSIVRGLEAFSIDQFYQVLYRPDLVREKIAGDPDGKVKDAAAKLDLAKLIDSGPVPKVAITSHKPLNVSQTDLVTVEAHLTDQGGGIGKAEWRISSKESGDRPITIGIVDKDALKGPAITIKQAVALDRGENTIELVAYNGENLVRSIQHAPRYTGAASSTRPQCRPSCTCWPSASMTTRTATSSSSLRWPMPMR